MLSTTNGNLYLDQSSSVQQSAMLRVFQRRLTSREDFQQQAIVQEQ